MPNEKRIISKSKLDAIAGAIREKTGSTSTYTPDQMVAAIGAIETQGDYQEKTFTENGTYTPDAGYDAFSQVTVNVQSGGSNPLQDMLDRSSNTDGSYLFFSGYESNILKQLTSEILTSLDFSNKHYTNASHMFYDCTNLTTIPQLDFSSVTTASNIFDNCSSLTTVPQLDFSSVTTASFMFSRCSSLTTIPQMDFSRVVYANSMFYNCSSLTTIPQMDFSKVTNASFMFSDCSSLTTIPQMNFSRVTNARYMFQNCTNLTTISQMNFSSVTNAYSMFYNCSSLTTIPQMNFSSVTDTRDMFSGCTSLTTLDFSNIKTIGNGFASYTSLSTLIIRNSTTLATLESTGAFTGTPIASGTGYIYVPDDLVDSYKQATNWSTFAAQIKPLSELPQGE